MAKRFAEADKHTLVIVLTHLECAGSVPMGALRNPTTGENAGSLSYPVRRCRIALSAAAAA